MGKKNLIKQHNRGKESPEGERNTKSCQLLSKAEALAIDIISDR